jgi:uncharacterized membrane protein
MGKIRGAHYLLCLALFFGIFGGLLGDRVVLAAHEGNDATVLLPSEQEEPPPVEPLEEKLEVFSSYPILQNTVGSVFEFEITLYYEGSEPRTFDLDMVLPEGWTGIFTGGYPETEISAFTVEPEKENETITLRVSPASENLPQPGEYGFTVRATSDTVSDSVDLTAVVIPIPPQYLLYMSTATLQSEFSLRPDQANHISLQLTNAFNGTVNNIIFTAEEPEGWNVTFTPGTVAALELGVTQEIDVVIIPPTGTEAGDYPLTLRASGDQTETEREYRITVVTATAWGNAGIGIAIAIIVGLAIWFRRAGTRGEAEAEGAETAGGSASWFRRAASRFRRGGGR